MSATLYYVHDPMCSWCWAFRPVLTALEQKLPADVRFVRLLGGLAPDSESPMPQAMREQLQQTWHRIEQSVPGTRFNFDFWQRCEPRRSTWPACRAVIAAREQGAETAMIDAIQQAYYLEARNPSDSATLNALAAELGLDEQAFAAVLQSPGVQQRLEQEMAQAAALDVDSYPSLVLQRGTRHWPLPVDYLDADNMLANLEWMLQEG